ncbi:MAG: phenylacetate-CoA oxygenase subunit PaaJ [Gammaproteobacteria bacterium]|nr:phenylacetate-CoA oxygenase subunit PaaJ [Gammaproteobacteria bacterium]
MTDIIPLVSAAYSDRLSRRTESAIPEVWNLLDEVKDPEIPALSIWDLGVLNGVEQQDDEIFISITPTYSGCPAMGTISDDIGRVLSQSGYSRFSIKLLLAPAWTTDWMSPEGRIKLREYGIAPPENCQQGACQKIACPHCGSTNTETISEFGSTACKALHRCQDCDEPFDYFKSI